VSAPRLPRAPIGWAVAAAAGLALAAALPDPVHACTVCMGAREDNDWAFVWTTILLGGLPLGMIGGLIGWLCRRERELRAQERGPVPRAAQDGSGAPGFAAAAGVSSRSAS
jgi:hypothetical protein